MEIPRDTLIEAAVAHSSHQIVDQENLGYYRTKSICSCGASWMTGDREGDPDFYVEKALHELGPAALVIAEWARKEALKEALAGINKVRVTDSGPLGDGYDLGLECAADVLRELAD